MQEGGHQPLLSQLQPSAVGEVLLIIPPCLMTPGHVISAAWLHGVWHLSAGAQWLFCTQARQGGSGEALRSMLCACSSVMP